MHLPEPRCNTTVELKMRERALDHHYEEVNVWKPNLSLRQKTGGLNNSPPNLVPRINLWRFRNSANFVRHNQIDHDCYRKIVVAQSRGMNRPKTRPSRVDWLSMLGGGNKEREGGQRRNKINLDDEDLKETDTEEEQDQNTRPATAPEIVKPVHKKKKIRKPKNKPEEKPVETPPDNKEEVEIPPDNKEEEESKVIEENLDEKEEENKSESEVVSREVVSEDKPDETVKKTEEEEEDAEDEKIKSGYVKPVPKESGYLDEDIDEGINFKEGKDRINENPQDNTEHHISVGNPES